MSHFIQDNQAVIETKEGLLILLVKGGDNNCFSGRSNKRITSWSIARTFKDYNEYMLFINEIMATDVHGDCWQFQSLKNKSLTGYTQYEHIASKKFTNAYNNRIKVEYNLNDVNYSTIESFISLIENEMSERKFKITNEDGMYSSIYKDYYIKNESDFISWFNARLKPHTANEKYKDFDKFIEEYKDKSFAECLQDYNFCKKTIDFNLFGKISFLFDSSNKYSLIPYENFKLFISSKPISLIGTYKDYFINVLDKFPSQMKRLIEDGFIEIFEKAIEEDKKTTYPSSTADFNLLILKDIKLEELEKKAIDLKNEIENINKEFLENSKSLFIEQWNNLTNYAWYKTTYEKLPREVAFMENAFNKGNFKLEEINQEELYSLVDLIRKHNGQNKKNQKAIKELVKLLLTKYIVLLDDEEIEKFTKYFNIKINKDSQNKETKLNIGLVAASFATTLYSQEILDIFSQGTLF